MVIFLLKEEEETTVPSHEPCFSSRWLEMQMMIVIVTTKSGSTLEIRPFLMIQEASIVMIFMQLMFIKSVHILFNFTSFLDILSRSAPLTSCCSWKRIASLWLNLFFFPFFFLCFFSSMHRFTKCYERGN